MIVFNLKCSTGHAFEAWFKDNAAYDKQSAAGVVTCPECGDTSVEKALMAPKVGRGSEARRTELATKMMGALREMRETIETSCDYVGPRFAEEARKIHYGESEARGIYGEATNDEAVALEDEGVAFGRVPWAPREDA